MVICFYPGSGGNRYLLYHHGLEHSSPYVMYDGKNQAHIQSDRYFDCSVAPSSHRDVLSHCVNTPHISKLFPGHEIVLIKASLQQSLRRAWMLDEIRQEEKNPNRSGLDKINSAFALIQWHDDYYHKYPYEALPTVREINLEDPCCDFSVMMRDEMNRYHDEIFDLAWEAYQTLGPNAPIFDIFEARSSANT